MQNWKKLAISLLLPQIAAAGAAYVTVTNTGSWYADLQKPEWNPPNWLFGPVWTVLYVLMGISFFLIWRSGAEGALKRRAIILWGLQLVLNCTWSLLFFGLHEPGWATAEIILLWAAILATILAFAPISKVAAWLMVPYIAWVSFAGYLCYTIWQLNS